MSSESLLSINPSVLLVAAAGVGLLVYIGSVRTLGRWSPIHGTLLTGLVLLTPQTLQPQQQHSHDDKNALDFHQTILLPGSLAVQTIQEQQQQEEVLQRNQQQRRPQKRKIRSAQLKLWKYLDSVGCLVVACLLLLVLSFAQTYMFGSEPKHRSTCKDEFELEAFFEANKSAPLGMSWLWWGLALWTMRSVFQLIRCMTLIDTATELEQRQQQKQPNFWFHLLATSPKSCFHAFVTGLIAWALVFLPADSKPYDDARHEDEHNNSLLLSALQELAVRVVLGLRLLGIASSDSDELVDVNTENGSPSVVLVKKLTLGLQWVGVILPATLVVLIMCESIQSLQKALWQVIYREGTYLKGSMLLRQQKGVASLGTLLLSWSNLFILPIAILGITQVGGSMPFVVSPEQLIIALILVWAAGLLWQLHSLLQDYLLGALLLCFGRQQQQRNNGAQLDDDSKSWIANVFTHRRTHLLQQTSQWVLWPTILVALCSAVVTSLPSDATGINFLGHQTMSPVAYQIGEASAEEEEAWPLWQEWRDWNQYQQNRALLRLEGMVEKHNLDDFAFDGSIGCLELQNEWLRSSLFAPPALDEDEDEDKLDSEGQCSIADAQCEAEAEEEGDSPMAVSGQGEEEEAAQSENDMTDFTSSASDDRDARVATAESDLVFQEISVPLGLLRTDALPPSMRFGQKQSLLRLLQQVQAFAKQAQENDTVRRALLLPSTSNFDYNEIEDEEEYETFLTVRETLWLVRVSLSLLFHHATVSRRTFLLWVLHGCLPCLMCYWIVSAFFVVGWLCRQDFRQHAQQHNQFLQKQRRPVDVADDSQNHDRQMPQQAPKANGKTASKVA